MDPKNKVELGSLADDCAILVDYVNVVGLLFGISDEDRKSQWFADHVQTMKRVETARRMLKEDDYGDERIQREMFGWLQLQKAKYEKECDGLKNGRIKILCKDDDLRAIALDVKSNGPVERSKSEFDKLLDFSVVDPFWPWVSDYTLMFLGGGVRMVSPEVDAFHAMCHFHDKAIQTEEPCTVIRESADSVENDDFDESKYHAFMGEHMIYVRACIVHACLFVEAFVNSVADVYRCKLEQPEPPTLDDGQRFVDYLFLQEKVPNGTPEGRDIHVSLFDKKKQPGKLGGWIEIISERRGKIEAGSGPGQRFVEAVEYRDSIVHLSKKHVEKTYRKINLKVAVEAVNSALNVAHKICELIAKDPNKAPRPWWLPNREASAGAFKFSPVFKPAARPENARTNSPPIASQ